jgi:hypothetical protein
VAIGADAVGPILLRKKSAATVEGGGEQPATDKPLKIGTFTFRSRLITGTGKYATYHLMRDCLAAHGGNRHFDGILVQRQCGACGE